MSETPPPRRPLATFLRATPPPAPTLIQPPVVPATAPAEQVVPMPVAELPAAPVLHPVPAPPAPEVAAPGASAVEAPRTAQPQTPPPTSGYGSTAADDAELQENTTIERVAPQLPVGRRAADEAPDQAAANTASDIARKAADRQDVEALDVGGNDASTTGIAADVLHGTAAHDARTSAAQLHPLPVPALAAPAFARRGLSRPRLRASGRQWALLLGLVGLLGLQIIIADRAHLAGDARWRPLVASACAVVRCTLPAWREPAALTLLNREVRPLPGVSGVLEIQASFRNDARWAQAWPWLQLSLSDADGRVIGTRVLSPQEYLGQAPAVHDTLAPGQAVQVAFRVREPAASTAAFSFDFR
ncbi:DUF3426 domain-containing protein [Xanthomonas vesicatoria]|uniref:DUF3426 domain-containing protein n=2 Tax=Xanthomonas vesicatoria TaxID=56460 RepID=UPI001E3F510F|nr:DUF3426 domain-containing protein [Xanthomonas vesicatoria]MCC8619779.1 DUF3426 domain-containing protein [Xanthomonas vesicatoria]MCC8632018.1 DUF3426 domain-containing protein [Xanthomonas vesicatoria]